MLLPICLGIPVDKHVACNIKLISTAWYLIKYQRPHLWTDWSVICNILSYNVRRNKRVVRTFLACQQLKISKSVNTLEADYVSLIYFLRICLQILIIPTELLCQYNFHSWELWHLFSDIKATPQTWHSSSSPTIYRKIQSMTVRSEALKCMYP